MNLWSAEFRATAKDSTGQNLDKGYTPNLKVEINKPGLIGNRNQAAEMESRNATDLAKFETYNTKFHNFCYYVVKDKIYL